MTTLREHLEAIIVRGYGPTKEDDRADAIAALEILDSSAPITVGDHRPPWHRIVPDPEPLA